MPKFHVTSPDGATYEIDAPEGATEQDAIAYVQSGQVAAPAAPSLVPTKPVNPALADARKREASVPEFVRSVNRGFLPFGLADRADAGIASAETGVNNTLARFGIGDGAGYTSDQAYDAVRQASGEGQAKFEEDHPALSTAGEVIGGVALGRGVGGLIGQIPAASGKVSQVVQGVGSALRDKPLAQFFGGMAGAGAGKVARDIGAPIPLQVAASLLAGGLGAAGYEGIRNGVGAVARTITSGGAKETASNMLREAAVDPAAAVAAIERGGPQVSGAQPLLSEASLDPGLAGFQRAEASTNIPTGARVSQRLQDNTGRRLEMLDTTAGPGDVQAVQDLAQARGVDALAEVESAAAKLGPAAYAEDSGQGARTALQEAHDAARARTGQAYNAPALSEAVPVSIPSENFKAITDSANRFYGDAGGEVPGELRQIIQDAAVQGSNTRALANIDRRLADYAGSARVAGRGREASFAEDIRRQIGAVAEAGMPEEQRQALAAARLARREQADIFENGQVGRALDTDKYGRPTAANSAVPQILIPKGRAGAEAVDQLVRATGEASAEAVVREELRRLSQGVTGAANFDRIATDFAPVLERFPTVAADLASARGAAALSEAFGKTALGRFANPAKDPHQVVETILQAKDGARAFSSLVAATKGNPEAADGLRRSLAQYVANGSKTSAVNASGDQVTSNSKMLANLGRVLDADAAAGLFSKEQAMALRQLQDELKTTQFGLSANRAPGSDTSRNTAQRFAKAGDAALGGLKSVRVMRAVLGLFDNKKEVDALLQRAILEPKFAAELIKQVPPDRAARAAQTIKASLAGAAIVPLGSNTAPRHNPDGSIDIDITESKNPEFLAWKAAQRQ